MAVSSSRSLHFMVPAHQFSSASRTATQMNVEDDRVLRFPSPPPCITAETLRAGLEAALHTRYQTPSASVAYNIDISLRRLGSLADATKEGQEKDEREKVWMVTIKDCHTQGPIPTHIIIGDLCVPIYSPPCSEGSCSGTALQQHRTSPVLVIGAGGIGCEVLKVLVLSGYRHLYIIDLDTIDGTNLNRQFLFTEADVGKSKSLTAREALLKWSAATSRSPPLLVEADHADITSSAYTPAFFGKFAAVLNALDNVPARQHVNRLCSRATPQPPLLLESGTMGFNGQVQPIRFGETECYQCHPKPTSTQQSFAVCTVHARPTRLVHCVHYAMELYEVLFGSRQAELATGDLSYLAAWREKWAAHGLDGAGGGEAAALALAQNIFHDAVERLLALKSVWASLPPVPLTVPAAGTGVDAAAVPRHQPHLSLHQLWSLYLPAAAHCCRLRGRIGEGVAFDKEDDEATDFIASVANLRAHIFHINGDSGGPNATAVAKREDDDSVEGIRTIAGKIVPAVVTANAIAGAGLVHLLERHLTDPSRPLSRLFIRSAPLRCRVLPNEEEREMAGRQLTGERRWGWQQLPSSMPPQPTSLSDSRKRQRESQPEMHEADRRKSSRGPSQPYVLYSVFPVPSEPPSAGCLDCAVGARLPRVVLRAGFDFHVATLGDLVQRLLAPPYSMEEPSITIGSQVVYEWDGYTDLVDSTLATWAAGSKESEEWLPLVFVVDAIDRPVEWEVEVHHHQCKDVPSEWEGEAMASAQGAWEQQQRHLEWLEGQRQEEEEQAIQQKTTDEAALEGRTNSEEEAVTVIEEGDDANDGVEVVD